MAESPASPNSTAPSFLPRRRSARVLVAGVIIAASLYVFSTPVLTFVGRQLVHADPLQRADVMIVLASAMDRVVEAADLYRSGYAPLVVLTTEPRDPADQFLLDRNIPVETNEQRRKRVLEALGVPAPAIVLLPDVVQSTMDEARLFARWAEGRSVGSVLIVTSPFHTARSRLTFRRVLGDATMDVRVYPSTLARFRPESWWRSRDTLRDGIFESQKLLYYYLVETFR